MAHGLNETPQLLTCLTCLSYWHYDVAVQALYAYQAAQADELPICSGDLLMVHPAAVEPGWFLAGRLSVCLPACLSALDFVFG